MDLAKKAIGRKANAIHGKSMLAMCSQNRRMGTDQPASKRWWAITRNNAPKHRLRKNMKASSHEKAKSLGRANRPMIDKIPPPTRRIIGTLRHLDKSSGSSAVTGL